MEKHSFLRSPLSFILGCALLASIPTLRAEEKSPILTPEQIFVTKKAGTEAPFKNAYWNNKEDGIYVDLYSGNPLFSSLDKYDSGTGWPSFTRPIQEQDIALKKDVAFGDHRTEVRSMTSDAHLGHVFDDGPKDSGGKRYCMNSAALRFVPLSEMKNSRYSRYLFPFAKKRGWETITLAGGCFWGMEEIIRKEKGIIETQTGYAGGEKRNPTYPEVSSGNTGHAESLQILFDPKETSLEDILLLFFKMHDPTTKNKQGNDVGSQYRSAIFIEKDSQKNVAEKIIKRVEASNAWGKPLVTEIKKIDQFWRAEEDHQKYLVRYPKGYTCHRVRNLKF
jgi:peptide methionine sulfoxide reductase msrA/msrB